MPRPTAHCSTRSPTPEPAGRALLARAAERLRLSARGYHRVLRVARTLADLEGAAFVGRRHVAEALSYRQMKAVPEVAGAASLIGRNNSPQWFHPFLHAAYAPPPGTEACYDPLPL